jgi:hypothetical protein
MLARSTQPSLAGGSFAYCRVRSAAVERALHTLQQLVDAHVAVAIAIESRARREIGQPEVDIDPGDEIADLDAADGAAVADACQRFVADFDGGHGVLAAQHRCRRYDIGGQPRRSEQDCRQ